MRIIQKDNGGVIVHLSNGCVIEQDMHPATGQPITEENMDSALKSCLSANDYVSYKKLKGIEFDGVMCSATADDQNGLMAVETSMRMMGQAFEKTEFLFSNGNKLTITKDNFSALSAVWMPFRHSFFSGGNIE